jgi:hypothetical protein
MSETEHEPQKGTTDAERDLAEHERPKHEEPGHGPGGHEPPDVGLIADEDLPEDLRPADDNPLAKNPGEDDERDSGLSAPQAEGMPDPGNPGAPA